MKIVKTLLAMSAAALIITGCATEPCGSRDFEDRGLISGWKFTPLQIAFGLSDDDPANFRRKILPFVEPAGGVRGGAGHRPAALYRRKSK